MRLALLAIAAMLLCGCLSPEKFKEDQKNLTTYRQQERARDKAQQCIDAGALPGSPKNLVCRLDDAKVPRTGAALPP